MGKYEPLSQFLQAQGRRSQRMTFGEIERVLGFKLPRSAYEHEAWWSNNATGHSHARTWLEAGWRTESVDLAGKKVTFQRSVSQVGPAGAVPKKQIWGCMAGTVTVMPGVDLTRPAGEVWNAEEGRLLNE